METTNSCCDVDFEDLTDSYCDSDLEDLLLLLLSLLTTSWIWTGGYFS